MNRREMLASAAALTASIPLLGTRALAMAPSNNPHLYWMQMSRYNQWVTAPKLAIDNPRETGVQIANYVHQIGYNAVNLGVRRGAHVDPVYAPQRLAPMVEGIRSRGIICDTITTEIVNLDTPITNEAGGSIKPEDIIAAASKAGIKRYRTTPMSLVTNAAGPFGADVDAQISNFGAKLRAMEVLNRRYNIQAFFHTFSGNSFTSRLGDFVRAAEGIDPEYIGLEVDVGHVFSEGTAGGWRNDMRVSQRYWAAISVKDASYAKLRTGGGRGAAANPEAAVAASLAESTPTGAAGNVAGPGGGYSGDAQASGRIAWVKAGTGMIPYKDMFQLLLQGKFSGPIESYEEYNLNGYALNQPFWPDGLPKGITREQMMANQKQDLDYWKAQARAAGWTDAQMS